MDTRLLDRRGVDSDDLHVGKIRPDPTLQGQDASEPQSILPHGHLSVTMTFSSESELTLLSAARHGVGRWKQGVKKASPWELSLHPGPERG